MAINKNHEFEELDGVKCAIVEKEVTLERVNFLKNLLACNGFTVVAVPAPAPKAAAKPATAVAEGDTAPTPPPAPPAPETFTVGVTDITFNATNAIFGRQLRTPDGHVVTLAYWQQQEAVAQDDVPYFQKKV